MIDILCIIFYTHNIIFWQMVYWPLELICGYAIGERVLSFIVIVTNKRILRSRFQFVFHFNLLKEKVKRQQIYMSHFYNKANINFTSKNWGVYLTFFPLKLPQCSFLLSLQTRLIWKKSYFLFYLVIKWVIGLNKRGIAILLNRIWRG